VLGRLLPESVYQRLLAASVIRDLRAGTLTEPELALVPTLLRNGETAIDVGANHGMWTLPMSRAVGEEGVVVAFEPVPFTAGTLRRVLERLGCRNVRLQQCALGEERGSAEIAVPIQSSGVTDAGRAHLASRHAGDLDAAPFRRVAVAVERLDDHLAELGEVALLKADVEGAELFALRGATALIARDSPVVVCEVDPDFLEGFGLDVSDLTGFFEDRGYRTFVLRGQREGRLEALAPSGISEAGNYVFVPELRLSRLAAHLRR